MSMINDVTEDDMEEFCRRKGVRDTCVRSYKTRQGTRKGTGKGIYHVFTGPVATGG